MLDLLIGDPYRMPHPIKLYGHTIGFFEKKYNKGPHRKRKGVIVAAALIAGSWGFFFALHTVTENYTYLHAVISAIFIFYGLANRTLIREVIKVNKALKDHGLEAGRKQLSFIVGRSTEKLDEQAVRKASLETLAENLSDGVIAPLFYLFIGGFPLMMMYKMINTLDSMIGYKNDRYADFGFFAAKTDDVFNYIPARITALLIALVSFKPAAFVFMVKFGRKHSSPNAGMPEAAMAGALNCQLGGPSEYHGRIVEKPYIGLNNRKLSWRDVLYACRINLMASVVFLLAGLAILLFVFH